MKKFKLCRKVYFQISEILFSFKIRQSSSIEYKSENIYFQLYKSWVKGNEIVKRAGVYFFYDKDGIVDRYVPYFINELHKVVDYIVVVVNGKLTIEGRKVLTEVADDLFVRENEGFDVWAYKEAIEYIGWDELQKFDELVLTNFTIFGPLFPFQETFDKMELDPCDFWGMHTGYGDKTQKSWFGISLPNGRPDYIASNFLVFKKTVLHSFEFYHIWEKIPKIKSYFESGVYFEFPLTEGLSNAGFIWATVDEAQLRFIYQNPTVNGALFLISKLKIPVLRKKAFYDPNGYFDFCTDIPCEVMRFIAENTEYECDLIWENLFRTVNLYDLKNWFNWNLILSVDHSDPIPKEKKTAVIFHTYYDDIMEQYLHNIESFPTGTDFYFTTDTEEKISVLQALLSHLNKRYHIEYRLVENRGRDMSALLVGCRDIVLNGGYNFICFMHDKKGIGNRIQFSCVGQSFSDCCFENIAASADYVNNVINLFEKNPRLGVVVPPPPKNANYYKTIGGSWGVSENLSNVQRLLSEMGLDVPIDKKKPPVTAYGSVFWFRPEALRPLFQREWRIEDFDAEPMRGDGTISNAIERSHGFIAQAQGYYTSVIMNNIYAEQEITRMTEIAHTYIELTLQHVGPKWTLKDATIQFSRMLQQRKEKVSVSAISRALPPVNRKPKGPIHRFMRAVCPIGLWNAFRRLKCAMTGDIYVETKIYRTPFKSIVRACTPRILWDQFRKTKCRENGWVFIPED